MPNFEDQFDVEVESPQGTLPPSSPKQAMQVLDDEESTLLYTGKSIDLNQYKAKHHLAPYALQTFTDGIINMVVDVPATYTAFVGKSMDDLSAPDATLKMVEELGSSIAVYKISQFIGLTPGPTKLETLGGAVGESSWETRVGEKMRNFGLALRHKLSLDEQALEPANFGEQTTAVLASGASSMLGTIGAWMAGGPAGAFAFSFVQEKAIMTRELMDAGYSVDFIDKISTAYAGPVAGLDVASLGWLGKLARPLVVQSVKNTVTRSLLKASLSKVGQVVVKGAEGYAVEGGTEVLQNKIQRQFETQLGLKQPDFQKDLTEDVAVFIGAGFIGGVAGAAGQLSMRREHITGLAEKFPNIERSEIAKVYDESVLRSNEMVYDELIQQTNVQSQMDSLEKAFAKIDGRTTEVQAEGVVEPLNAQGFTATSDLIDGEGILVDAKTKELQTQVKDLTKSRDQLNQQIIEQAPGKNAEEVTKLKVKLDEINVRLENAQAQYKQAVAGNPKLQALHDKLNLANTELQSITDDNERAAMAREQQIYMAAEPEGGNLYSIILQEGGIAPYKKGTPGELREEYKNLPQGIKNKNGLPLDEIADILKNKYPNLGITDEASLLNVLSKEKTRRMIGEPSGPKRTSKENIQKLQAQIDALETRIEGAGSPEEAVKIAEQKVEKIQSVLVSTFEQLLQLEVQAEALKNNPDLALGKKLLEEEKSRLQKQAEYLTEKILAAEQQAEAFRQGTARVTGKVSLNASQVRQMAFQNLRNTLQAYKAGVKVTEQSFKAIQKSFLALLNEIKFSNKAKTRLLRKVLTVRSAAQFNAKIGPIVDGINTILRGEQVNNLQKLGKRVLDKMMPDQQNVSPQAQLFAEHLQRVFREDVPLNQDPNSSDTVELAKAMVEQAVYDLKNSGDDVGAAKRSYQVLQGFYKDSLQTFSDIKARKESTAERLSNQAIQAISGGVELNITKESLDAVRQLAKRSAKAGISFSPYDVSFLSILDSLDKKSGRPYMQGSMVQEFHPGKPYKAWMVWTSKARDMIDGKCQEIYGKNSEKIWGDSIGNDFLDVQLADTTTSEGTVVPGVKQNIPKAAAMSLWLMAKMPSIRESLIKGMGINETWLTEFEQGDNVNFSEKDYQWMQSIRETLDWYADQIAPVYERITGRPFRKVDNYFMVQRYMAKSLEEGGGANTMSALETMLGEGFEQASVADSTHFKQRTKSKLFFQVPDIYQALSRYAMDMNHFLGYAEYVTKLKNTFQNQEVKKLMGLHLPAGVPPIIDSFIKNLTDGGNMRSVDREAMSKTFRLLSWYARNQVSSLKNLPRQFSAISAFTQYQGIGAYELASAAMDLPRAAKSGELAGFLDTSYMRLRFEGMYEFAVQYAKDIAHAEHFSTFKDNSVLGPLRRAVTSKTFNDLMTASARYGDRWASVVGGWAVYQKTLKETGNVNVAIDKAINSVEETQQSMDPGRLPVAFSKTDLVNRLLTVFQRTPTIFYDQYIRMQKAYWASGQEGVEGVKNILGKPSRMTTPQYIRAMVTWHIWVPIFEATVTSWANPFDDDNKWATGTAMLAGPFAMHILLGRFISSLTMDVVNHLSGGEAAIPGYLKDINNRTLLESFASEVQKAVKTSLAMLDQPDVDMMWDWIRAVGQAGDVASPVPSGWATNIAYGIYELFTGEGIDGIKNIIGIPQSQIK
jgi:hypothetical protein